MAHEVTHNKCGATNGADQGERTGDHVLHGVINMGTQWVR